MEARPLVEPERDPHGIKFRCYRIMSDRRPCWSGKYKIDCDYTLQRERDEAHRQRVEVPVVPIDS